MVGLLVLLLLDPGQYLAETLVRLESAMRIEADLGERKDRHHEAAGPSLTLARLAASRSRTKRSPRNKQ